MNEVPSTRRICSSRPPMDLQCERTFQSFLLTLSWIFGLKKKHQPKKMKESCDIPPTSLPPRQRHDDPERSLSIPSHECEHEVFAFPFPSARQQDHTWSCVSRNASATQFLPSNRITIDESTAQDVTDRSDIVEIWHLCLKVFFIFLNNACV